MVVPALFLANRIEAAAAKGYFLTSTCEKMIASNVRTKALFLKLRNPLLGLI